MKTEEGDMVKLNYTGRVKDSDEIFDTTYEEVAEEEGIKEEDQEFGPRTIIVGAGHVVDGLDEFLIEREKEEYEVTVPADKGFGEREGDLLKTFSLGKFEDEDINPFPGMRLQVNGAWGTVRTVSSGRVRMDFNHPLAGKDLDYEIDIEVKIEDTEEQVSELVTKYFDEDTEYELDPEEGVVEITSDLEEDEQRGLQALGNDLEELGLELEGSPLEESLDMEDLKEEMEDSDPEDNEEKEE